MSSVLNRCLPEAAWCICLSRVMTVSVALSLHRTEAITQEGRGHLTEILNWMTPTDLRRLRQQHWLTNSHKWLFPTPVFASFAKLYRYCDLGQGHGSIHSLKLQLCISLGYKCSKAQKVDCSGKKGKLNKQAEYTRYGNSCLKRIQDVLLTLPGRYSKSS